MKLRLSKKQLEDLYWKQGLSQNEIANIHGVAKITVQYWLYKYKIPCRPKGFTTERMRKKISSIQKGKHHSPDTEFKPKINISKQELEELYINQQLSMRQIGRLYNITRKSIKGYLKKLNIPIRSTREEYEQLRIKNMKEFNDNPENKLIMRNRAKKVFSNPESRKKSLKALMKRPTRLEDKFIKMVERYKLPYKYVGDGEFILGGKCPDFLNCNGKKQVIEIFGRVFHDPRKTFKREIPYHQTEKGTVEHYKKYGFKCLIIWEEELNDEATILDRVGGFK